MLPDRAMILEFDRAMDSSSVASHLTITPTIEGQITWPSPKRLLYTPFANWSTGTLYTATLSHGARDALGTPMQEAFQVRFRGDGRGVPLPILMYHHIGALDDTASEAQRTWTVSPDAFAAQMAYLSENGWQSISASQLYAYLAKGDPLPPRPTMITMDDGYKEVYNIAYPVLVKAGLRPVLFIVPQYVGYGAYLNWSQLEELVSEGFVIGSHGYDHSNLRKASDAELEHQMADSKARLVERLGVAVDAFCYPYGSYDDRVLALLSAHGYSIAVTLNPSVFQQPDEPYRLSRLRVSYETTLAEFVELLP